jgi:cytoskeleton protein RodZ
MKKTGLLLKDAREKQGVSLNAVSAATKISVKVLESIEEGDLSQLPPKTFVRGFVQTYATYLKLDPKTVMDVFQEEVGRTGYNPVFDQPKDSSAGKSPEPTVVVPKARDAAMMADKPGGGGTKWVLAGLALFLFIAIYFVSQTVQKYKKESEVSQLPPEITSEEALPENAIQTPSPAATPPTDAAPAVAPTAAGTASAIAEPTPLATASVAPVASPAESPKPTAEAVASPTPSPSASPQPSPSPTSSPSPAPSAGPQEITIEALDTVKVDFSIDGGPVQSVSLEPEQKRKFSAKRSFTADVSDGGAISIIHNRKDRGVPGNLGQPIQLSFPPKE